jgi:hypothetical protein
MSLKNRYSVFQKTACASISFLLILTGIQPVHAQSVSLPATSIQMTGITVHPENPLQLDFIVNDNSAVFSQELLKIESEKLVKYFLASLTVPEKDMWVNLPLNL